MSKINLKSVYDDTVKFFKDNSKKFPTSLPKVYDIYRFRFRDVDDDKGYKTTIEVTEEDSFVMAERYISEGLNPVVLNFASDVNPGGGVKKGSIAQEEDLFRRSNYFQSLNRNNVNYPLKNNLVYSSDVYISKTPEYNKMNPIHISCIACAAVRKPEVIIDSNGNERFARDEDRKLMKSKIEAVLNVAIYEKHNSVVLGAWGCGVFACPRDELIEIFEKAISLRRKYFKKIGFAILIKNKKDEINYGKFKRLEN